MAISCRQLSKQEEYLDPAQIEIVKSKNHKQKNLILIYAESLEKSFENKELFSKQPLKKLNEHRKLKFETFQPIANIGQTITGIFSSQCSIPLKSVTLKGEKENSQMKYYTKFFPGVTCLGDSLKKLGYTNTFLGGAHLTFAAKGSFLKNHGYDERYGKKNGPRLENTVKMI